MGDREQTAARELTGSDEGETRETVPVAADGDELPTIAEVPSAKKLDQRPNTGTDADDPDLDPLPEPDGGPSGGWSLSMRSRSRPEIARVADAMRADEIERVQVFYRVIVVVLVAVLAALPLIQGDQTAKIIFSGGLLLYALGMTWFVTSIRNPENYTVPRMLIAGVGGLLGGYTGVYFFGVFSPAPAMIVMALYFNSLIGPRNYTLFMYVSCAAIQAGLAGLILTGVIVDRGLINAEQLDFVTQLMTQSLIQASLLATFLIARLSRATTEKTIGRFERAVRDLAQREALLNEAKAELERAAWVGGPGRFTEQIIGSFQLGVVIGRGAMGEVYEAEHVETRELAAVKLLHRNMLSEPHQVQRFTREVNMVASLASPNVVRVLEVADPSAPLPYLAMERMRGHDLGHLLRRTRKLPVADVCDLVTQIARGLMAARAAGIVHRDLKPQNLFAARQRDGGVIWKVMDFGVSKLVEGGDTLTKGHVVGTPTYMSPEQARGKKVDHRADVYALGAIAYRAMTGHPAFSGREVLEVLHKVVKRMPVRPTALMETLHRDVDRVLALALAKRARKRFESAAELADALRAAVSGELSDALRQRADALMESMPWAEAP